MMYFATMDQACDSLLRPKARPGRQGDHDWRKEEKQLLAPAIPPSACPPLRFPSNRGEWRTKFAIALVRQTDRCRRLAGSVEAPRRLANSGLACARELDGSSSCEPLKLVDTHHGEPCAPSSRFAAHSRPVRYAEMMDKKSWVRGFHRPSLSGFSAKASPSARGWSRRT